MHEAEPNVVADVVAAGDDPLLDVRGLWCSYGRASGWPWRRSEPAPAVRDVSLRVAEGHTVALVGESGSGKTTVARAVAGLLPAAQGEIRYAGRPAPGLVERRDASLRRDIQYVFQNADASLNPRHRVGSIVGRPLELFHGLHGEARRRRVARLLEDVHLDGGYARRFPAQLSGGERQRVAIARALAAEPRLLLCDEILTALDVSVQAAILQLLREVQAERGLAYLFISHDLSVVRTLADHIVVLCQGEVVETGNPDELFGAPAHPYTRLLIESIPDIPRRAARATAGQRAGNGPAPASADESAPTPRRHQ